MGTAALGFGARITAGIGGEAAPDKAVALAVAARGLLALLGAGRFGGALAVFAGLLTGGFARLLTGGFTGVLAEVLAGDGVFLDGVFLVGVLAGFLVAAGLVAGVAGVAGFAFALAVVGGRAAGFGLTGREAVTGALTAVGRRFVATAEARTAAFFFVGFAFFAGGVLLAPSERVSPSRYALPITALRVNSLPSSWAIAEAGMPVA